MEQDTLEAATAPHPHLRLVWSRPADLPPLPPRRPLNLALAIERHLAGIDGFTQEQFVKLFALGPEDAPAPDPPAPCPRAPLAPVPDASA